MSVMEPKTVTLKNGQEVCIRTATFEDAQGIIEYLKTVFQNDRTFLSTTEEAKEWQTLEKEREYIEKHNNGDNLLLMAEVNGQVVSLSGFECGDKQRIQHVGELHISTLSDYRRIGLGTAVMQAMIDWATERSKIEKISLGVWSKNAPAIGLYNKMGFVEEGRKVKEIKYADGSYEDMVCMYRFVK